MNHPRTILDQAMHEVSPGPNDQSKTREVQTSFYNKLLASFDRTFNKLQRAGFAASSALGKLEGIQRRVPDNNFKVICRSATEDLEEILQMAINDADPSSGPASTQMKIAQLRCLTTLAEDYKDNHFDDLKQEWESEWHRFEYDAMNSARDALAMSAGVPPYGLPEEPRKVHELKTDPKVFAGSAAGLKTFEIRMDDRDFQEGDELLLRETVSTGEEMKDGKPLEYTGRVISQRITHILRGPVYGLQQGWAILSVYQSPNQVS